MKKFVLFILGVVFCIDAFAQSEHLAFKGVPINGTLKQFVSNMVSVGFTSLGIEDGFAGLKGDFAGYKDCVVVVSTLQNKDLVSHIDVLFPEQETWAALEGDYSELKRMLSTKYGRPARVVEEFKGYVGDSGPLKIISLENGDCTYQTVYNTEKGDIVLRLECFTNRGVREYRPMLSYYDKINGIEKEASAMDDL